VSVATERQSSRWLPPPPPGSEDPPPPPPPESPGWFAARGVDGCDEGWLREIGAGGVAAGAPARVAVGCAGDVGTGGADDAETGGRG
jgi:hypothetical protein